MKLHQYLQSLPVIGALLLGTPSTLYAQEVSQKVTFTLNLNDTNAVGASFGNIPGIPRERLEEARNHLFEALTRLKKNPHFPRLEAKEKVLFSLMVKESFLQNSKVSASGAKGYFQLKQNAVLDAEKYIERTLKVRAKKYDIANPVDNCILGTAYYLLTQSRVKTLASKAKMSDTEVFAMTLLSYNLGVGNTGALVTIYLSESKKQVFDWDEFVVWMLKKASIEPKQASKKDMIYQMTFQDWFPADFSQDTSLVVFSSKLSLSKAKIQESINYVEKIKGLLTRQTGVQLKDEPKQIIPSAPVTQTIPTVSPQVQKLDEKGYTVQQDNIFAVALAGEKEIDFLKRFGFSGPQATQVFHEINSSEFEGITPTNSVTLKEGKSYKLPVVAYKIVKGDTWKSILTKKGISQKFLGKLVVYNQRTTPSITQTSLLEIGSYLSIPLWKTGFYTENIPQKIQKPAQKPVQKQEQKIKAQKETLPQVSHTDSPKKSEVIAPQGEFHFQTWIESIEKKTDKLKGKVFVLDPGHGGPDIGAAPIARDKNGIPIIDERSAIKVKNENKGILIRVKPGTGSNYLLVYESIVTLDVSYRLAKLIKENGGDVFITRYNKTTGIIDAPNPTTPVEDADVFGDTQKSWRFTLGNQIYRLKRGVDIASNIAKQAKEEGKEVTFLSIHADSDPRGDEDNPITFRYYKGKGGVSSSEQQFASLLASNITFRGKKAQAIGQGLFIINPKKNPIAQSVLVELANMKNRGSAFILRQPEGRQRFANALFEGILKTVTEK